MLYQETEKVKSLKGRLQSFMDRHVYPNEERFYKEAEEHAFWPIAWRFNYHQGFGVA
jgi:acyl-CoA dehydrogenase